MSDPINHKFDTSTYVKLTPSSPKGDDELEAVRKLLIAERDQLKRYKSAVMSYMLSSLRGDADKTLFEFAKAEGLFAEFEASLD